MPPTQSRVWFITGASTGFGRFLAEEVLLRGERVLATARDLSKISDLVELYPNSARAFVLDVTDPEQIASVAEQAIAAFGHVDVLVNNAGFGIAGAIEEVRKPNSKSCSRPISMASSALRVRSFRISGSAVPATSSISRRLAVSSQPPAGASTTPPNSPSKDSPKLSRLR